MISPQFTPATSDGTAYAASPLVVTQATLPDGTKINYGYENTATAVSPGPVHERRLKTVQKLDASNAVIETTTYHYEVPNGKYLLTGVTDSRGVRISTFEYDSSGRVKTTKKIGDADRYTITYADTSTTMTRTVTNPLGRVSTYQWARSGRLTKLLSVTGAATTNCPSDIQSATYFTTAGMTGFTATETDQEGRVTAYLRDSVGRPTSITRGSGTPQAVTTTYTYHPTLNAPATMAEPGLSTAYTWTNGQLTSVTQTDTTTHTQPYATTGQARTTAYTYSATGQLLTVDGPLAGTSDTVTYTYTAQGYLATVTNQVGHVTTVNTLNGRGQPTQITNANGIITDLTYDAQGRLKTTTVNPGANGATTTYDYDAIGQITKITRPDGSYLAYVYSDAKRLTSVTNTANETIEYTHDLMGNVLTTKVKSAAGAIVQQQSAQFDEIGRLLRDIGAANQTTTYAYERNNNLKSVIDPRGGLYSYAYDSLNRLIRETDQNGGQVNLTRNAQDEITTYADPRALATTYVRNGFGEIIRETSPDRGITVHVRDARGLVTQTTDGRGVVINMTYDAAGRLLTKAYPAATAEDVTYTYDTFVAGSNFGRGFITRIASQNGVIDRAYDARGNIASETRTIAGSAHTVAYAYDAADRVVQITYPSGRLVTYTRDTTGRIIEVTTKANAAAASVTLYSSIVRHPHSNLVLSGTYGNGLNDFNTVTLNGELDVLGLYDGATSVINRAHTRADNLNLTNIFDNVTPARNQTFGYEPANRLQNADASGLWGSKTFFYDNVGNRIEERSTPPGGAQTIDTYGYPATSNRLVQITRGASTIRTLAYDNAGNLTSDSAAAGAKTYVYNSRNRLSSATIGAIQWTYVYNGLEQLAIRTRVGASPADITHYVHDIFGNIIAETDGGGPTGTTGTSREYIYLPEAEIAPTSASRTPVDRPVAVVEAVNTASPVLWHVHVDHLHRPIRMTDAAKASVWDAQWLPWGGVHAITGSAVMDARFPGQWFQSETGLHYNWHRSYDASIGRYTQPDPLGFVDGPSVYGYAHAGPQGFVDFDGQDVKVCVIQGASYNPFGHMGFAVGDESVTSGFYPPGNNPFRSIPGIVKPDTNPQSSCKVLPSTEQQDGCMKSCRNREQPMYRLAGYNCTHFTYNCLKMCGFKVPPATTMFPKTLIEGLK